VGQGGRPGHKPSSLLQKERLDRRLAFKRWARGRCFSCLERGHQVGSCVVSPSDAFVVEALVIGRSSVTLALALRLLVLALWSLMLGVSGAAPPPSSLVVLR
jgi:hypothetical protein